MEMESGSPVVSTTSSMDLQKDENGPDIKESTTENADSTVQNNDETKDNNNTENEVHLIGGLSKPSPELEKVEFLRVSCTGLLFI